MNVKTMVQACKSGIIKHAPGILTGTAIAGLVVSSYLWVKGTPKAQEAIAKKKEEKGSDLTKVETVKAAAPSYIPAMSVTVATAVAMFMAHKITAKQMAALFAAYQLSEEKIAEWKENTLKTVGQSKVDDIEQNIARSHMAEVPVTEEGIINTGKGHTLYFDKYSGRYFWSDRQFLREVELDLNELLDDNREADLNDYYDMILLERVKKGNDLMWIKKDPYKFKDNPDAVDRIRFKYTAAMHPTLNVACTEIDFVDEPTQLPF